MTRPLSEERSQDEAIAWRLRLGDGPLTTEKRAALDAWLAARSENRDAFARAETAWAGVGERADRPGMVVMRGVALQDLRRVSRIARFKAWASRPRLTAMAAGMAAILILALLSFQTADRPRTLATGLGERQAVMLADGSRVSLDAESVVTAKLTDDRRVLNLEQGRARFTVAHDPLRPFAVTAGDRTIVAIGTDFSVERIDGTVRVILYEGRVSALENAPAGVRARSEPVRVGPDRRPVELALRPGEELVLAAGGASIAPVVMEPDRSLGWEAGRLAFSNEPLGRAVARINRYAARPVRVADEETAEVRISGVFAAGDTEAFIEGVAGVFPVTVRRVGEDAVLMKKLSADR